MPEIVVSDASPLISLAILHKLDILAAIYKKVVVPETVYAEVTAYKKPFADVIGSFLSGRVVAVCNQLAVDVLSVNIDAGEAEAIILALELKSGDVLMDDYKARKVAEREGLTPVGTLGLLIEAKRRGLIQSLKSNLDILMENNRRISSELYNYVLNTYEP